MTKDRYVQYLLEHYHIVHIPSDKPGHRVLHLRHQREEQDMILRLYDAPVAAYESLCNYRCRSLPTVYDVVPLEDGWAVLEEYIDGATVADILMGERYEYPQAKQVMLGVCEALVLLHKLGQVHRDIKPENVMIDRNGRVVLIDLDASRTISSVGCDTQIMGTVGYVAPEQLGIAQSDARTDIYAAGVLLNVMLTGKHPSEQIVSGRAGRIVRRCTAVNPNERYASAERLARAL